MNVEKEARLDAGAPADEGELELINRLSRKKLTAEEVYVFGVRLCDNEVDRDFERFDRQGLERLGELFVGKTGIFDHQWSAGSQCARIYRTQLVEEPEVCNAAGEPYCYLKGYAYMLRTEGSRELIAQIEGGIKKEVSVGCAVRRTVCSICGGDMNGPESCGHVKGRWYDGALCYGLLQEPVDAYEWSFVAVPAQPRAGVVKGLRQEGKQMLKELLGEQPECLAQLEQLEREAELGRRYLAGLRREVARLGGLAESGMEAAVLNSIAGKLEEPELLELKRAYERRLEKLYPPAVQLGGEEQSWPGPGDEAFLV